MSLRRLVLRDFVIVRELELDLSSGFTVLTGETGAGKSILIDALQLALGNRADAGVVREGATRAEVCAEFQDVQGLQPWLDEAGIEGPELLLRRTVDAQGKSRAWINGTPVTAGQLREVGAQLLDIHGQHAWQSLTRAESVRVLLDAYAGIDAGGLNDAWQHWRQAQATLAQAREAQNGLQQERERLAWQMAEMAKLAPAPNEWAQLNAEHSRLAHAQSLMDAAHQTLEILENEDKNATKSLSSGLLLLQKQEQLEPAFKSIADVLASALAQVEDATYSLHAWLRRTDLEPERLAELDERLGQWVGMARRLRRPPEELPQVLAQWQAEWARLDQASDLPALEAAEQHAAQAWHTEARRVSALRHAAAPKLSRAITAAMQQLGMQGGRFEVELRAATAPGPAGLEETQFLVAGHAGSTPRPVGKVASGGELSRIALAIAVTTSQLGTAQTLIFDEVDSGVGGAVASNVGRLLQQLGRDRQVLAITHLPQVAAHAHHHWIVAKRNDGDTTFSTVAQVAGAAREGEIARMLGGTQQTDATRAHAREMLDHAAAPAAS